MQSDPPKDIWEVDSLLQFNEPLDAHDPRYVHTEAGRGDFNFDKLYKTLGVNPSDFSLRNPHDKQYILFCGHRGCGKSTELRRLSAALNKDNLFFVLFVDVTNDLDPNNLEYSDVLMALANELFKELQKRSVDINKIFLSNLKAWFDERIEKHEKTKVFASEIKAGIEAKSGIPFFAELFGKITNSFKINSTYKDELRKIIKNSFSQFADAFNQLIIAAETEIKKNNSGQKILFIIDGTDRLTGEDTERFFINDTYQLQLIKSNFIYCAPISLLYESNQAQQMFNHHILPMIKITEKNSEDPFNEGYEVLRQLIYKRVDESLFDSKSTVDYLIRHSGGCPRELLKLLHYTFLRVEGDNFDIASAEKAVCDLATDYKRILEPEDFQILVNVDMQKGHEENSERMRYLLFNLALLEYDHNFWRKSHPVVRLLEGYNKLSEGDEEILHEPCT